MLHPDWSSYQTLYQTLSSNQWPFYPNSKEYLVRHNTRFVTLHCFTYSVCDSHICHATALYITYFVPVHCLTCLCHYAILPTFDFINLLLYVPHYLLYSLFMQLFHKHTHFITSNGILHGSCKLVFIVNSFSLPAMRNTALTIKICSNISSQGSTT